MPLNCSLTYLFGRKVMVQLILAQLMRHPVNSIFRALNKLNCPKFQSFLSIKNVASFSIAPYFVVDEENGIAAQALVEL